MTERPELTISDFARRCRLPISTLRYYDKIGLLTPAMVDAATGYRRYTVNQLARAAVIFRLRSFGTSPERIARIVAGGLEASAALIAERQRIQAEIVRGWQALGGIDELLYGSRAQDYQVDVIEYPPRQVAALPFVFPLTDLEAGLVRAIAGLRSALRRGGYRRSGPWSATFPLELTDEVSGIVFAPVDDEVSDDLEMTRLPRTLAVRTVHHAGMETLPLAYHAAFEAIDAIDGSATGPVIEEYHGVEGATAAAGPIQVHVPYALKTSLP